MSPQESTDLSIPDGLDIRQQVGAEKGGRAVGVYIDRLAKAQPGDVQKIVASQISLLTSYYNAVLAQATMGFRWAVVAAGAGLILFLGAIAFLLITQITAVAVVGVVGGAIVEVISGINFMLYGKTTTQLAEFHERLDQTQRFLLANSICETLEGEAKQKTRAGLVSVIAGFRLQEDGHLGVSPPA